MAQTPDRDTSPTRWRSRDYGVSIALGMASLLLHLAIAIDFDAAGAFDQQDLFFHADVQARLECAVGGRCAERSNISHPSLAATLNPPIRLAAAVSGAIHGSSIDPSWARHRAALFVSPIAAGIQTGLIHLIVIGMGFGPLAAGLLAGFATMTFSGLLFGAMPESFALSAAAILIAYLLAADRTPAPLWQWGVLGVFATGVTITNIVPIALLHLSSAILSGDARIPALARSLGFGAGCVCVALMLGFATSSLFGTREPGVEQASRYVTKWMEKNDPIERGARFPTSLLDSIVATEPTQVSNYQSEIHDSRYRFRFSFASAPRLFSRERAGASLVAVLALWGAAVLLRRPGRGRVLALASLAILLFNACLHAFWGVEHFLYSQHWVPSLIILVSGVVAIPGRSRRLGCGGLAAGIVGISLQNFAVLRSMLAQLVDA